MAQPFVKIPGARDRALKNAVPGLKREPKDASRPLRGAVLGISREVELRHKRIGRAFGWTSLTLALLFLIGGVVRFSMPAEVLELESVRMGFATLGVVAAMGIHLLLFAAEALRGRDAPRATAAVVIFWGTFLVCGLW